MRNILIVGAAAAAIATTALAQQSPQETAVKARQAHMTLYSANLGVLGAMAQGNMDYDAERAQMAAGNLAALAQLHQGLYWLPGTSHEEIESSRTLPALWENGEEARAYGMALAEAAVAMEAVAGDGVEALQANLGAIGRNCGGCHEDFRLSVQAHLFHM